MSCANDVIEYKCFVSVMPTREYQVNHPYGTARALQAYVKRALQTGDEEVLLLIRPIILQMAEALRSDPSSK